MAIPVYSVQFSAALGTGSFRSAAAKPFSSEIIPDCQIRPYATNPPFLFNVSSVPFDGQPNLQADVEDLDKDLLFSGIRAANGASSASLSAYSPSTLARRLHLTAVAGGNEHTTQTALLFFCRNPASFLPGACLEVIHIPEPGKKEWMSKSFHGPLPAQLREALQHLQNCLLTEKIFKHDFQAEADRFWNYPYRALETVLFLAACYHAYQSAQPILVEIRPEEIRISFCPADPDLALPALNSQKDCWQMLENRCPNRQIYRLLEQSFNQPGFLPDLQSADQALKRNGSHPLYIAAEKNGPRLAVILPVHPSFLQRSAKKRRAELYQDSILAALQSGPLSLDALAKTMGYKRTTKKLKDTIRLLAECRRIVCSQRHGKILYCLLDQRPKQPQAKAESVLFKFD